MWLFYGYKILFPILFVSIVLFFYVRLRRNRAHHGWWTAFLIFSISMALIIPFKANPFQRNFNAYKKSEQIVKQLKLLTTRDLFSEPKLRENVTEEDIKNLEEQLPTVAKNKKEKAETYVNDAWGAYDTQQTVQFFVTEMNYNNDTPYQVLEVEKINLEKLEEAHERVKQLPEGKERRRLSEYLEQIEQAR